MRATTCVSKSLLLATLALGCGSGTGSPGDDGAGGSESAGSGHAGGLATGGASQTRSGGSGGTNRTETGGGGIAAGVDAGPGVGGATNRSDAASGGAGADSGGAGTIAHQDAATGSCAARPALTAGVWKDITPAGLGLPLHPPPFGIPVVAIDPSNPCVLYACVDTMGLWKTTDAGTTWARLGTPPNAPTYATTVSYIDSPIRVLVDPNDSQHLYATQGVRGSTLGFWVSHDAGKTWSWPPGFITIAKTTTNDLTILVADPADFNHVLLGSHSPWSGRNNAGILETKDGGNTFIAHDPVDSWSVGSLGINFLSDPELKLGNGQTWLVGTDGNGLWRTTDSGATWKQVSSLSTVHGGQDIYYSSAGVAYVGGQPHPARSLDNGATWTELAGGLPSSSYYTVQGDGTSLYTQLSNTGDNGGRGPQPYMTSKESDGLTWTPYQGGAQTFGDGPFLMRFDAGNRIMYSANWDTGLWALKVLGP